MIERLATKLKAALGLELGREVAIDVPHAVLGTEYGAHCVATRPLEERGPGALVYSFGLGEDVSFDLALIERFAAEVWGFDPTPRSIAWLRAQVLPAAFHLVEQGIAARDGALRFYEPQNPAHISHSLVNHGRTSKSFVEVEVRRLDTLLRDLGHPRLDVLKLDVEGAEYEVLDDLLAGPHRPTQLLVEFHHHLDAFPLSRTRRAIDALAGAGYRLFHIAPNERECSFLLVP
jgi:FkbM family methyltransferase